MCTHLFHFYYAFMDQNMIYSDEKKSKIKKNTIVINGQDYGNQLLN